MADMTGPTRTETQSIESDGSVATVVAFLAGAGHIPLWAPAFADLVSRAEPSGWRATKDGRDFELRVVVDQDTGTVDYLRAVAPGREGGVHQGRPSAWWRQRHRHDLAASGRRRPSGHDRNVEPGVDSAGVADRTALSAPQAHPATARTSVRPARVKVVSVSGSS